MIVRISIEFDDDWRGAIAAYHTRVYETPRRKFANREQCKHFVREALENWITELADLPDAIAAREVGR